MGGAACGADPNATVTGRSHVIARWVERRAIFRDDDDRERFAERLVCLIGAEAVASLQTPRAADLGLRHVRP
jgi:hypothetical protein